MIGCRPAGCGAAIPPFWSGSAALRRWLHGAVEIFGPPPCGRGYVVRLRSGGWASHAACGKNRKCLLQRPAKAALQSGATEPERALGHCAGDRKGVITLLSVGKQQFFESLRVSLNLVGKRFLRETVCANRRVCTGVFGRGSLFDALPGRLLFVGSGVSVSGSSVLRPWIPRASRVTAMRAWNECRRSNLSSSPGCRAAGTWSGRHARGRIPTGEDCMGSCARCGGSWGRNLESGVPAPSAVHGHSSPGRFPAGNRGGGARWGQSPAGLRTGRGHESPAGTRGTCVGARTSKGVHCGFVRQHRGWDPEVADRPLRRKGLSAEPKP